LIYEHLRRRRSFRDEAKIRLADNQIWTLPGPPKPTEAESLGSEYNGLIQALIESEEYSETRKAELVLVTFLLNHNYSLNPADFEDLLVYDPVSRASITAWFAFHRIAEEHVRSFLDARGTGRGGGEPLAARGRFSRVGLALRSLLHSRKWSLHSPAS
jgi:hypothetical protein